MEYYFNSRSFSNPILIESLSTAHVPVACCARYVFFLFDKVAMQLLQYSLKKNFTNLLGSSVFALQADSITVQI